MWYVFLILMLRCFSYVVVSEIDIKSLPILLSIIGI